MHAFLEKKLPEVSVQAALIVANQSTINSLWKVDN